MLLFRARRRARLFAVLLLVLGLLSLSWSTAAAQDAGEGAVVDVLQLDGPLDGPVAGHVEQALERAEEQGVEAVVLQLDTAGGLGRDGTALADRVRDSTVPLVLWVGPPGAQVSGAGLVVAQAAHMLAMSQASTLGGAAPLDLADDEGGPASGDLLADYAARSDRPANVARRLGQGWAFTAAGEDVGTLPADLEPGALPWDVEGDRSILLANDELVERGVAELVANDLPDVLRGIDGSTVTTADGAGGTSERTIDLDPVTANVRFDNLGLVDRVLHAMADPTLAYLLLIGGALTMLFEVYQPGFGVAGGAGAVVVALSAYGLWVLPTSWWALGLVALGLALLAVDLAIAGLGPLTLGGTASLAAGSYWLFDGPPPLQTPTWVIAVGVAFSVLYFVVIMTAVLRAQGAQAMVGAQQVIGKDAVVRSMLNPEGHVFVDGALWRARAPESAGKVKTGTPVHITGMSEDGLTLEVAEAEQPAGDRV